MDSSIPAQHTAICIARVSNGWAVYPGEGVLSYTNNKVNLPLVVARNERELSGMIQGWAEVVAAKSE